MQMGRWFGYRQGYEDLCRIYMTRMMSKNFALIIEATEDLIDNFKRMAEVKMTPNDFGLCVKYHPDSGLQVTARNKQKSAKDIYFEMKLDGHAKETSWLHNDEVIKKGNLHAVECIINNIVSNYPKEMVGNSYVWKDVNKGLISEFLEEFKVYTSDPFGLQSRMPIDFVKKYVSEIDTFWDVALYSGDSGSYIICDVQINKEKRQVSNKGEFYEIKNRQVSSGSAESITFPLDERKSLGSDRKSIREKMKKPLLMLHVLDVGAEDHQLAAFGISFPGGIKSTDKTVKLKINTVYVQGLLDEEEYDD
jgi:hypothetical protein